MESSAGYFGAIIHRNFVKAISNDPLGSCLSVKHELQSISGSVNLGGHLLQHNLTKVVLKMSSMKNETF